MICGENRWILRGLFGPLSEHPLSGIEGKPNFLKFYSSKIRQQQVQSYHEH